MVYTALGLSSILGAIITSISARRFPVIISKGRNEVTDVARVGPIPFDVLRFGHALIELSQMILARSEDDVMARSLIIAHAPRHRVRQRQLLHLL